MREAEWEVRVVINLLHEPAAGGDGDDEAGEIEQSEGEDGAPGEGVADAAVDGIGLVFVKAEDVGAGLGAGELAVEGGDAGCDEDGGSQRRLPRPKPWAKREKVSGPGARKKTQIQMGQWARR